MKCVVQTSGGLDSAASFLWTFKEGYEVYPVFYDYGQPYRDAELKAARSLAWWKGVKLDIRKIDLLPKSNTAISEYVPYRNLVLTAHSISLAGALGYDAVVVGSKTVRVREDDAYSFRDSSLQFYSDLQALVKNISEPGTTPVQILMPLVGWSKAQVVQYLSDGGINPKTMWTCYSPGPEPCGVCYHCKEFAHANLEVFGR